METVFLGRSFFSPTVLPSSTPGGSSLVTCQFLVVNEVDKKIQVVSVFGIPLDLPPGSYRLACEARPKSGKSGINYWYKSHQSAAKAA